MPDGRQWGFLYRSSSSSSFLVFSHPRKFHLLPPLFFIVIVSYGFFKHFEIHSPPTPAFPQPRFPSRPAIFRPSAPGYSQTSLLRPSPLAPAPSLSVSASQPPFKADPPTHSRHTTSSPAAVKPAARLHAVSCTTDRMSGAWEYSPYPNRAN